MGHSQSPWLYQNPKDAGLAWENAYAGLPLDIIGQIMTGDGDDPAGDAGIQYYFNHFHHWEGPLAEGAAAGWNLAGVTGTATIVHGDVRNGSIVLTADATGSCDPCLQLGGSATGACFRYSAGKQLWCMARLKLDDVDLAEFFFGLGTPDTQPTVTNTFPSDGIFFEKATTATDLDLHARQDGTSTEKTSVLGTALADDTYVTIGFKVDTDGNIMPYRNGVARTGSVIAASDTNIPDASTDILQFMVAIMGASRTCTLDWLLVAQEL